MYWGWGGGDDTHKATENNAAEIIEEGKYICGLYVRACVCVCLQRGKNQQSESVGAHGSMSYSYCYSAKLSLLQYIMSVHFDRKMGNTCSDLLKREHTHMEMQHIRKDTETISSLDGKKQF